MKNLFNQITTQPYFSTNSYKQALTSSLFIAIGVYLFLIIFQPFGTYNYESDYKYLLLIPYSLIAFLIFLMSDIVVKNKSKNVTGEVIRVVILLAICSAVCYLYNIEFISHASFRIYDMIFMFLYTLAIGTPICLVQKLGSYVYLYRNVIKEKAIFTVNVSTDSIIVKPDSGADFTISTSDFLFAESDGNYSTIHYLKNNTVKQKLLRLSLKNLDEQINNTDIVRCHRSYIVNTAIIMHSKGNAQGYKLGIKHSDIIIPVSRSYIKELIGVI